MVKIDMPDSPFALPPMVYSQCLSREDLIPRKVNENDDQKCDVVESKVNGDAVSWTVVCDTPQGKSTSKGSVTYKGESFEGEIIIEAGENTPAMTQSMSGKRVGSCE